MQRRLTDDRPRVPDRARSAPQDCFYQSIARLPCIQEFHILSVVFRATGAATARRLDHRPPNAIRQPYPAEARNSPDTPCSLVRGPASRVSAGPTDRRSAGVAPRRPGAAFGGPLARATALVVSLVLRSLFRSQPHRRTNTHVQAASLERPPHPPTACGGRPRASAELLLPLAPTSSLCRRALDLRKASPLLPGDGAFRCWLRGHACHLSPCAA